MIRSFGYRLAGAALRLLGRAFEFLIRRVVDERAFLDTSEFPWVKRVEAGWHAVREELIGVMDQQVPSFEALSPRQRHIIPVADTWKTYFLYAYGRKAEENCRRCPQTTSLLESIPGVKTAMFSILAPHSRITQHRGPFKGVLRYHLGLIVPGDGAGCAIRVGDEVRSWREGESLVFDDTLQHEAWNDTDERRVVLFVDFIRDLPFPLGILNRGMVRLFGASPGTRRLITEANRAAGRIDDAAVRS